jgi:predicted transcriptional regulator
MEISGALFRRGRYRFQPRSQQMVPHERKFVQLLSRGLFFRRLMAMEVQLTPETEKKLNALAAQSGRRTDDLVEDAMAGYLDEVAQVRDMLDRRYDDLKSGRLKPVPGKEVFDRLRARSEARKTKPGS